MHMPARDRPTPTGRYAPRAPTVQTRRNRRALLAAAREVIGRDGAAAPLSRIAAAAGLSEPAVHRHFGNRSGLHETLLAAEARFLRRGVAAAIDLHDHPDSPDPLAPLHRVIAMVLDARPALAALLMDPADGLSRALRLGEDIAVRIDPVLRRAQSAGIADPQLEPIDLLWAELAIRSIPPEVRRRLRTALCPGPVIPRASSPGTCEDGGLPVPGSAGSHP